jgi:hypothetical protein
MSTQDMLDLGQLALLDFEEYEEPLVWRDSIDGDLATNGTPWQRPTRPEPDAPPATIGESRPTPAATEHATGLTMDQARAVLRWSDFGINVLQRWRLMFAGLDDTPTDAGELLRQARLLAGGG